MYCPRCGKAYQEDVNFCCQCGAAMNVSSPCWSNKKLHRSRRDRKIAGVCGGFAEYLEIDSTLVRVVWLMSAFFVPWGFLGYFIAWIVMPDEPKCVPATACSASAEPAPSR
ncbi:MAG TPA: PspC domain-containing protein [Terriglobia bacterium]|nr:PspC domain-containing protein [Terriglobia bacterium]